MIRKITSTLFILLITTLVFAQKPQQIIFQYQYLPNKKYTILSTNTTSMVMNVEDVKKGTESEQNKEMQFKMTMDMSANITTGQANANKDIPLTMTYDKFLVSMEQGGKKMEQPAPAFANLKMIGYAKGGKTLQIDSISGLPQKDEATKKMMKEMIGKLQQSVKFPERPIKVGDTFNMVTPFKMPMQDLGNLAMNINIHYMLKEIKEGKAYLDITQELTLDMVNGEKGSMNATGNGTGIIIYDIAKKFITQMDINMTTQMNMKEKENSFLMKMGNTSSMKTTID